MTERVQIHEGSYDEETWFEVSRYVSEVNTYFPEGYTIPFKRTRVVEGNPELLRRQIGALERSITEKWEPIEKGLGSSSNRCALCDEFGCYVARHCPLDEDGDKCNDNGSTYNKWLHRDYSSSVAHTATAARPMLNALRESLRKRRATLADLVGPEDSGKEDKMKGEATNDERRRVETQVERLTESIDGKWTRLVGEPTTEVEIENTCPLCKEYQSTPEGRINKSECKACPLDEDGQNCLDESSTYQAWYRRHCSETALGVRDALVASRAVRIERLRVMPEEIDVQYKAVRRKCKTCEDSGPELRDPCRECAPSPSKPNWRPKAKADQLLDEIQRIVRLNPIDDRRVYLAGVLADALGPVWLAVRDLARAAEPRGVHERGSVPETLPRSKSILKRVVDGACERVGRG